MAWGRKPKPNATPVMPQGPAPEPTPPPPLAAGERVGDYQIQRLLGEGGFGRVYLADDVVMHRLAVVKLLHPAVATSPEMVERFFNEARTSGKLAHPNVVTVFACGRRPDGQPFIAYEYLDGGPLSRLIATTAGPMDLRTIVTIGGQAAAGLHKAHTRGIVHRDVKPDNIFLTSDEATGNPHHVHIIDFGIAKLGDSPAGGVHTKTNMILGSPGYSAPEQLRSTKEVDARADLYSLACVLWQMTTGELLWPEGLPPAAMIELQLKRARPTNPCAVRPGLPAPFGAVIARGLEFEPGDRWASLPEFLVALAKAAPPSDFGAATGKTDAMDLLYEFAPELTRSLPNADTAGRPMPELMAGAPTQRLGALMPGAVPILQLTPPPPMLGQAPQGATVHLTPAPAPTIRVTPSPQTAQGATVRASVPAPSFTIAAPSHPTTIGGAAGESVAPASTMIATRRARPVAAGVVVAGLGVVLVAFVATRSGSGGGNEGRPATTPTTPAVATPTPSMAALTIITEPAGASIVIDGAPRGLAPATIRAPVGVQLEIRAELAGYVTTIERVRVAADAATVRLALTSLPMTDAAVVPPDAGVDAAPTTPHKRRAPGGRGSGSAGFSLDDVIGN